LHPKSRTTDAADQQAAKQCQPAVARTLMGRLFDAIRQLVAEEKYVVGEYASDRLEERGIMEWQAVAALQDGDLIAEKPRSKPNPTIEVRESLLDDTEFKAVWSLLPQSGVAKLVTVHFFDRGYLCKSRGNESKGRD
jgi:hypothetical protein